VSHATDAALMVMDAVPLMVVSRNLGHSDTRMVEKHYGHLATSYVREAIRAQSRSGSAIWPRSFRWRAPGGPRQSPPTCGSCPRAYRESS
jgi:hypothetical protein